LSANYIADDVRRFIHEKINSVEQLEVLLLLRCEPRKEWSAMDVSRHLFTVAASASLRLEDLHTQGLLALCDAKDETGKALYRYEPRDMRADETVAKLDNLYRERKDAVIQLIFSRPPDRIQTFSDAFRIKREE
jgi:hypothetical protein